MDVDRTSQSFRYAEVAGDWESEQPMITAIRPPGKTIEQFDVRLPDGRDWTGSLYATKRRGGRRIIIRDLHGDLLFDTDDCFDFANAQNKVEIWLRRQLP